MKKRVNTQTHYCMFAASLIKKALVSFKQDRKNYLIQQEEYANNAAALRELYEDYFHTRDNQGWSQNKLSDTQEWYWELNYNADFEPRCILSDEDELWYKIEEISFTLPENKKNITIEDVVMKNEISQFDGSCTVRKARLCFLKANLDRNRKSFEDSIVKRKEKFWDKHKPTRPRNRRGRTAKETKDPRLVKVKSEPQKKVQKRKPPKKQSGGEKKRHKAPLLGDMVCRIMRLLARSCPRTP